MPTREATCHCGQLRLAVDGDPFVVSICNCRACQRRTGSAFGMQAAFRPDQVTIAGRYSDYVRISDEADAKEHVFHFCPDCGSQVFGTEPSEPDFVVVAVGAFADPALPGADRVRVRLAAASVDRAAGVGLTPRARALVGLGAAALPGGQVRGRGRPGPRAPRDPPRPAVPLLQRRLLREPRRPDGRRDRAPRPGDRDVGRLPRPRGAGHGLRRDPR